MTVGVIQLQMRADGQNVPEGFSSKRKFPPKLLYRQSILLINRNLLKRQEMTQKSAEARTEARLNMCDAEPLLIFAYAAASESLESSLVRSIHARRSLSAGRPLTAKEITWCHYVSFVYLDLCT